MNVVPACGRLIPILLFSNESIKRNSSQDEISGENVVFIMSLYVVVYSTGGAA